MRSHDAVRLMLCALLLTGLVATVRAAEARTVRALFIGNSYTARSHLADIVRRLAEAAEPGLKLETENVVYGGQTLAAHWKYRTQNWCRIATLTPAEEQRTIDELQAVIDAGTEDPPYRAAIGQHRRLLARLNRERKPWDYVILQSWRDTARGLHSSYAEYTRKFAQCIHAEGGRVVLYETTPATQNASPLQTSPDPEPALANARFLAQLADELHALVAPMSLVVQRCQTERPELTLRYVKDGHPNQTMAYLTACTIYAVVFNRSPRGLSVNHVTDDRVKDPAHPDKNPDGGPQTVVLPDELRTALQRIAWEAVRQFRDIASEVGARN